MKGPSPAQYHSYEFLYQKELSGQQFSLQDLADATGWEISTIHTYLSKKWRGYIKEVSPGVFIARGIVAMPKNTYFDMMSQINRNIINSDK